MTSQKLISPCKSCDWKGDRNRDQCVYCQDRRHYLHICFGESLVDTCVLYAMHQDELALITPARQLDFSGPGPKAREFECPICKATVLTSHRAQRTCNQGGCPKAYERQADAARKDRNRERDNKQARERRRLKRLSGGMG